MGGQRAASLAAGVILARVDEWWVHIVDSDNIAVVAMGVQPPASSYLGGALAIRRIEVRRPGLGAAVANMHLLEVVAAAAPQASRY